MIQATVTSQQRLSAGQRNVLQQASIGVVKETMPSEYRVGITPSSVQECILNGHKVYVQSGAGTAAGYSDQMYVQAGATMMQSPQVVYQKSQIMMKVMQPMTEEYSYIQQHQIIFCFFTEKNGNDFIKNMMQRNAVVFDYRSITDNYTFPIMNAMSELSGHLAVQHGMKYMEKQMGGMGMFMGKIAGVQSAHVLILGGGVAAVQAATFASNLGANVTIMDISTENLNRIAHQLPRVKTMMYCNEYLEAQLPHTDLLIGAVMPHAFQSPMLVHKEQMKNMKPMSVAVDLAMEFGGNFETSQITTWDKPTFMWNNIIHFCVCNIAGCVPHTASEAMNNAALPYVLQVANMGWKHAAIENSELLHGIIIAENNFTCEKFSSYFNVNFTPMEMILEQDIKKAYEVQTNGAWNLKHQLRMLNENSSNGSYTVEA